MTDETRNLANAIRFITIDTLVQTQEGHPGTPLGGADIVTALFADHLKFDAKNPQWPDRDRFVHSAGHGSMLLYSLLYLSGYEAIDLEQIKAFRTLGSRTPGHPEHDIEAGIETTTGPLGQGIANAVGMAVAEQMLNHRFGDDIVNHFTYAYVGDGCLMEGIAAEVIAIAGHLQLGKLVFLWDDNEMSDDGPTHLAFTENTLDHFKASNWHVQSVDGHDAKCVSAAIGIAKDDPRPSVIACKTIIGKGIPRIQGKRCAHGMPISHHDKQSAREYLNWPYEDFQTPDNILSSWRQIGVKGAQERNRWESRVAQLNPDLKKEFERLLSGELPNNWLDSIQNFIKAKAHSKTPQSTILASGELSAQLAKSIPELINGAPDLEGTTQHKQHLSSFTSDDRGGRYIHYGVREHAMGAMVNGMNLHGGIIATGATYLVFADYMRHPIRLAALMKTPSIFIFSHDSIGIGTNGATHQPVECLASLRALPNMWTLRPADAIELAECWQLALTHKDGPTSLICSRQDLNIIRDASSTHNLCAKGAYILAHESCGERKVTLIATGSEVHIALKARGLLEKQGIGCAVVSMPSWELFEKQSLAYRQSVINKDTIRVAIEAAVRLGWDRYIGENGHFIGMNSFGASAPQEQLFKHFNITAESVVETVMAHR